MESWNRQYRSAVFVVGAAQQRLAEETRRQVAAKGHGEVHTAVEPAGPFYPAEDYHQKYLLRHSRALFAELRNRFASEAALLASTSAARLNGYLGCNGSLADLEREIDSFGLSPQGRQQLLGYLKESCRQPAGPTCPAPS
jgi:peptide-methionine (S)-S-oxide reductase